MEPVGVERSRVSLSAKAVFLVVAGLALTCALWVAFRPNPTVSAIKPVTTAGPDVTTVGAAAVPLRLTPAPSNERTFELVLKKGLLVSGPDRMKVQEGDIVVVEIVSDTRDELHLHGYNLRAQITPGQPTRLSFSATRTGRFTLELHQAHSELGALEVYPR
jgi:hypothetical protein